MNLGNYNAILHKRKPTVECCRFYLSVRLQDHSYSSSALVAPTYLTPTTDVADIPTSHASISAQCDDRIDPSTVKEAVTLSGEEIEQVMEATTP